MNAQARSRTLIRKTSLLRKIGPIARRSSFANKGHLQPAHLAVNERRNDLEKVQWKSASARHAAPACDPKLGSISSLRCQKSRTRFPKDCACKVMFCEQTDQASVACSLHEPRRALRSPARPRHPTPKRGGARRDRTDDLMLAKHALSQLSYGPVPEDERCPALIVMVGLGRLELPTSRLSSARSNQLSYKPLTRGACLRAPVCTKSVAQAQPLARVRPRRKRNEDGEIPPMQLNNPDDRWPLMFLRGSIAPRSGDQGELKNHP